MITESAVMASLFARVQQQTNARALFGEPSAIQTVPLLYLLSNQTDYEVATFTTYRALLSPRIRIVVAWQDAPNAETQLLAIVDDVFDLVTTEPLPDAYWCSVKQILYGYLTVAGTRYRMAQLALDVAQYQGATNRGNYQNSRR